MTKAPLISVCIANYNGSTIISACIESVLGQDGDFPVEILVHDDASTDDSADLVARDYPCVRLIRSETNVGFCVANNRMVAKAQGEFILLLNNDAELFPDALLMLLKEARALGKPGILSVPQYDHGNGNVIDRGCLLDPFYNPVPNLDLGRREVAMVIGACLWLPKRQWEELGGFPEWFGSIGEDLYLCCRARVAGYSVRILAASGYRHRVGMSFGGGKAKDGRLASTFRRRCLSERNKSFVIVMTCPVPYVVPLACIHLLLLLIEGGLLSLIKLRVSYLGEIYLPVFGALFRLRKVLIQGRCEIMDNQLVGPREFFRPFVWMPYKLRMLLQYGLPTLR